MLLGAILGLALTLRLVGLNWDHGIGLHPDERMLIMVTEQIGLENLNPEFFNYGSLPIYLLKIVSSSLRWLFDLSLTQYAGLFLVGRGLSIIFDLGTVVLVYLIGRRAWNQRIGLVAAFLYATAVFPIQNAHFYTVDTQLTFWMVLILWLTISFADDWSWLRSGIVGGVVGLAAATKITGLLAFFIPLGAVLLNTQKLFQQSLGDVSARTTTTRLMWVIPILRSVSIQLIVLMCVAALTFFLTQPYVAIDFSEFWQQITLQTKMARDATIFPYTLQFIGTTAYLTPLAEIVRWGLGYPLGFLALTGVALVMYRLYQAHDKPRRFAVGSSWPKLLIVAFFLFYFLILGRSAVKFMRYYLPMYPLLAIFAAVALDRLMTRLSATRRSLRVLIIVVVVAVLAVWPAAFMRVYLQPHSRIVATEWLNQNLPRRSTIAVEHWDDRMPLQNEGAFGFETLEVYQPETDQKWNQISRQLARSDYLIISSNRVYRAIMNWPEKYPATTEFYRQLFANQTSFKLVKTFISYPSLSIGGWTWVFSDAIAPLSFTIYDHPQVLVFEREK